MTASYAPTSSSTGAGVYCSRYSTDVCGRRGLTAAGLAGSGRELVAGMVTGRLPCDGTIEVEGAIVPPESPGAALAAGLAWVTGERARYGMFPNLKGRGRTPRARHGERGQAPACADVPPARAHPSRVGEPEALHPGEDVGRLTASISYASSRLSACRRRGDPAAVSVLVSGADAEMPPARAKLEPSWSETAVLTLVSAISLVSTLTLTTVPSPAGLAGRM